nr:hypothetical protein BaRGS_026863 [Batillaria attramentaria]
MPELLRTELPPAVVHFNHHGDFAVSSTNSGNVPCPQTHFQCAGNGYCLPVYVRCNGVYDCPGKEDEAACDSYTCPGFYRCRASRVCVHPSHLCDGAIQCPQRDDELMCDVTCPVNCTCYGMAFFCRRSFMSRDYPQLRFLDASGTGMSLLDMTDNIMLIHLSLAECRVSQLDTVSLPNLQVLDLSDNDVRSVSLEFLSKLPRLKYLSLSANPLTDLSAFNNMQFDEFPFLTTLDLSRVYFQQLNVGDLEVFSNLETLNLSDCDIERVPENGFRPLQHLQQLDLRGCPMTDFPRDVFRGLDQLDEVYADNYKLCCPATLPAGFNLLQCRAPTDEISSCDALLRSDVYRVLLAVFAALAVIGNLSSFVYRSFVNRTKSKLGFGVFVTHLCVSDFLMGVYLAVIGVADRLYQGTYLWNDLAWKNSAACKIAGFLSLLSSEVSAFIICLITLDRFLVLRFPFSHFHFQKTSANITCALVWILGLILAVIPLLPMTSHWEFYSQTGICIPLPITRKYFAGSDYAFGVMIVLNFVVFLQIATGQAFIYWSIRSNSMSTSDSTKKSKDLTIARRLFTVVLSDFLCWFPIGLLGLLAANDVAIPGEVSVAMAIIVLPLNSALNPFLYTVNMILERRRQAMEQRIEKEMLAKQKVKAHSGTSSVG